MILCFFIKRQISLHHSLSKYVNNLPYNENIKAYLATQIELDRALEYLINQLEKSKVVLEGFKTYNEIFPWFLLLALIFLSTEYFLKLTRYKVLS